MPFGSGGARDIWGVIGVNDSFRLPAGLVSRQCRPVHSTGPESVSEAERVCKRMMPRVLTPCVRDSFRMRGAYGVCTLAAKKSDQGAAGLDIKFQASSEMEDRNAWRGRILSLHTYPTMRTAVQKFKTEVLAAVAKGVQVGAAKGGKGRVEGEAKVETRGRPPHPKSGWRPRAPVAQFQEKKDRLKFNALADVGTRRSSAEIQPAADPLATPLNVPIEGGVGKRSGRLSGHRPPQVSAAFIQRVPHSWSFITGRPTLAGLVVHCWLRPGIFPTSIHTVGRGLEYSLHALTPHCDDSYHHTAKTVWLFVCKRGAAFLGASAAFWL
eukprot:1191389-Prorocentrum_minimum.AAC.4